MQQIYFQKQEAFTHRMRRIFQNRSAYSTECPALSMTELYTL
jgi:hypothetical protein